MAQELADAAARRLAIRVRYPDKGDLPRMVSDESPHRSRIRQAFKRKDSKFQKDA